MQLSGHKKRSKNRKVHYRLIETTVEHASHSLWTEFGRNSSPVWFFYSREKKVRVWRIIQHFVQLFSHQSKQVALQPLSLFSSAIISGGHIRVAINTWNDSPTFSVREENPSKSHKRIKPNWFGFLFTSVCQFKHSSISVFQILNFRRTISTYF